MHMIYKDDPIATAATVFMFLYGIDAKPPLHHIRFSKYALRRKQ